MNDRVGPNLYIIKENDKNYFLSFETSKNLAIYNYLNRLNLIKVKYLRLEKDNYIYKLIYPYKMDGKIKNLEDFWKNKEKVKIGKVHLIRLKRLYQMSVHLYSGFEQFIRSIELKEFKEDIDFIYLSKFHIIMRLYEDLTNEVFKLKKIFKKEIEIDFNLLIGRINLRSVEMIDLSNIRYGYIGSDIARILLSLSHPPLFKFFKDKAEDEIFIPYIKVMTYIILILNLEINYYNPLKSLSNYNEITLKMEEMMEYFKKIK